MMLTFLYKTKDDRNPMVRLPAALVTDHFGLDMKLVVNTPKHNDKVNPHPTTLSPEHRKKKTHHNQHNT
jgi:hypothetical protein